MNFKQFLTEETSKKNDVKNKVIEFLTKSNKVSLEDIQKFSEKEGLKYEEVLTICFGLLTSFFSKGRFNEKGKDIKFDKKELKLGIKVEYEHTDDPIIAERIAKDHLTEIPGTGNNDGYYSLLERMEAGVYD